VPRVSTAVAEQSFAIPNAQAAITELDEADLDETPERALHGWH
jgi:hypothetical protein